MNVKHEKPIMIALIVVSTAIIFAVFTFMLVPSYSELKRLSREIIDAQTELEAQYQYRKHLLESIEEVERIHETSEKLLGQFIEPGEELSFITNIESIAEQNGVDSSIRLSARFDPKRKKNAPVGPNEVFEIQLVGPFVDVQKSVRDIERQKNIVVIESVDIRASEVSSDEPMTILAIITGRIAFKPANL